MFYAIIYIIEWKSIRTLPLQQNKLGKLLYLLPLILVGATSQVLKIYI